MYPHAPHSPLSVAGSDYTSVSVDLTFSATTTSQTVTIVTSTDSIVEDEETFTLSLTSTDPAVMPQPVSTTVSITDMTSEYMYMYMVMFITNYPPFTSPLPPFISGMMIDFNQPDYTVTEGQTVMANVQVMSEVTLDRDVMVTVQTGDGSATAGSICHYEEDHIVEDDLTLPLSLSVADADYTSVSMILTIPTGTISAGGNLIPTVTIMTSNDNRVETQETFTLSLTSTDRTVIPQSVSRTVSITDMTSEYMYMYMVMSITIPPSPPPSLLSSQR